VSTTDSRTFPGTIGTTYQDSTPAWTTRHTPRPGSPNVVIVLLDDVGFASLGCFGSEIATPTMDGLAARGLRYRNFHTTALCSPTRASLLTGRNHHSVGMSIIANADSGYPSKRGSVSDEAGTIAEILRQEGYSTLAVGKWHLAPADQTSMAGPFDQWPLGRGFERFYGFLDAATDQFHPELTEDNHRVDPPYGREEGYHLTEDLVDHAISFVNDQTSCAPDRPFLLYLAPGATHSPHQAPDEYLRRQRGRYEVGWDVIREQRLARQKQLGIVPSNTEMPARNPGVVPWQDLSVEEQQLHARFQEAYAAFLEHTDDQLGRLVDHLQRIEELDKTLFVLLSDNGASQEGQVDGSVNMAFYENKEADPLKLNLRHLDDIGTWRVQNNYPLGWATAANTPLKRYKQNTHAGGVRDPLIISWPAGITDRGGIRDQFHHVTDILPTVLDVLDVTPPERIRGVPQMPIHGVSMAYSFAADGKSRKQSQYFEMFGHRALWADGWKAVAYHEAGTDYDEDRWELYHLDEDFSECHDLSAEHPERLRRMIRRWWADAEEFDVLPLDDRGFAARRAESIARPDAPRLRDHFVYRAGVSHVPSGATPFLHDRSYEITARAACRPDDEGVLVACGGVGGGYSLYVKDGALHHDYNFYGAIFRVSAQIPPGPPNRCLGYAFRRTGPYAGTGHLLVDGVATGEVTIPRTSRYFMSWAGLDIGRDALSPVTAAYDGEFPFTGILDSVEFTLSPLHEGPGDHESDD